MEAKRELDVLRSKFPNHVPIVVSSKDKDLLQCMTKKKLLVGSDVTMGQLLYILRKKLNKVRSTESVFLFINDKLVPGSMLLQEIYQMERDETTGMLHVSLCKENTFGARLSS